MSIYHDLKKGIPIKITNKTPMIACACGENYYVGDKTHNYTSSHKVFLTQHPPATKIQCECGSRFAISGEYKHKRTQKHRAWCSK